MEEENQQKRRPSYAMTILRVLIGLAVIGIFIGSSVLLFSATLDIARAIWNSLSGSDSHGSAVLRVAMIEAVDTILVSTVLYVIAIGIFQLFVDRRMNLPAWLHTEDIGDLERRLAGMVVSVISVIFLTQALEAQGGPDLVYSGLGIAAVIAAIGLFSYVEGLHRRHDNADDSD